MRSRTMAETKRNDQQAEYYPVRARCAGLYYREFRRPPVEVLRCPVCAFFKQSRRNREVGTCGISLGALITPDNPPDPNLSFALNPSADPERRETDSRSRPAAAPIGALAGTCRFRLLAPFSGNKRKFG